MALSQNGWQVLESYGGPLVSNPIPGTNGVRFLGGILPGDVDTVLRYAAARWHREIEPITGPESITGQWGYNYRAVRGQSSGFSNHASGTAVDINSAAHPIGTQTLGRAKLQKLRQIMDSLEGVVRAGAFYSGRVDEMHLEVNTDSSALARIAGKIRANALPNVPGELRGGITENPSAPPAPAPENPAPAPTPEPVPTPEEDDDMAAKDLMLIRTGDDPNQWWLVNPVDNWKKKMASDDQKEFYRNLWGVGLNDDVQAPVVLAGYTEVGGSGN